MMAVQQSYNERLQRMESSITNGKIVPEQCEPNAIGSKKLDPHQKTDSQSPVFRMDSFSALRMRFLRQGRCTQWCDCTCHTYTRTRTSPTGQAILGSLIIGYTGLPALTPPCRNEKCRRSSEAFLQVNYYFPTWFVARAVSLAVSIQNSKIPKISMRVLNLRNSYEEIFQSCIVGDVHSVRYLLMSGQASVHDISDDSGHTPLHVSIQVCRLHRQLTLTFSAQWEEATLKSLESFSNWVLNLTWRMNIRSKSAYRLMRENAQLFRTPYDMASDNIFYFDGTPNAGPRRISEVRTWFPTLESVEERRRFTRIHKIVLQILHLDLEKELRKNPSLIDEKDADGRTPLSWAAARGDSKSVEALLRHGASPDTPDRIGQGPLRQAIKACDATCAKLLLAYGAKVDQRDDWSQTCLLSCMYYSDPVSFAVPFLKAGAEVNVRCSQGRSPAMEAVNKNNPEALKLLLDHGADIDNANDAGATPLHEGIRHNSHEALITLLESTNVDYTLRDKRKRTILHWAAEYADLETLNILRREGFHGLSPEDQCEDHLTAIEIAEDRRKEEEARRLVSIGSEWITGFRELLESLMVFNTPTSVMSYTGSVASEDAFVDALQHLTVEEREELAMEGQIPAAMERLAGMQGSMLRGDHLASVLEAN